ncbi:D-Ala-D-Ala carboxypeptidase family metallohydrolase [Micromonospora yangpuensis]|uniref:D-Ala-D-Ala carboxypeptidase family metallohydrolase n=1 Tax=Micromonospora yangpuensis TaxID=683228 RepID=UPI0019A28355|nr:D-Ala-D-Ala carboxypeptidase family metallohydrolase [Micromonospora yangpuensis]GGM21836.1 muramoylpentapeptide carboxypeptidase [Micromonospora yangpuensis]
MGESATSAAVGPSDACFTWTRTLSQGATGPDVTQLQIRISGWVEQGETLAVDGVYGPATAAAVRRFKAGYGLQNTTGTAGPETFNIIYSLQKQDCTPTHFSYPEFTGGCGETGFSGGAVPASVVRQNLLLVMWQLEALRHKLGDRPIVITSGFRSVSCNSRVGGATNSLHTFGKAADLGLASRPSQCQLWRTARTCGFREILGPGYPGHDDHVHVANRDTQFWRAPNC